MVKEYIKIVCIDESDPFEYKVLEDTNKKNLDELHKFLEDNYHKHTGAGVRWIILPAKVTI